MCSKIKMYLRTDSVLLPGTVAATPLLYPTSPSLHLPSQSLSLHCWLRWHSSLCANWVQWWWLTAQLTWYVPALCFLHEGDHTAASGSAVVNGFVFSNVPEWPIRLQWLNALVEIWEHWKKRVDSTFSNQTWLANQKKPAVVKNRNKRERSSEASLSVGQPLKSEWSAVMSSVEFVWLKLKCPFILITENVQPEFTHLPLAVYPQTYFLFRLTRLWNVCASTINPTCGSGTIQRLEGVAK